MDRRHQSDAGPVGTRAGARYCVVIPAFNAAKTIGALVRQVRIHGFPVIVVDDGSDDQTAAIAAREGALVISHVQNRGKGTALRSGFEHVLKSDYAGVVTMDSDGQHDPAEISRLVQAGEYQHAGIVIGNRMGQEGSMPFVRRWTNRLMSGVVSRLTRQSIPDSQCGFRLIYTAVLSSMPLRARRFELETELLLAAATQRWKMVSIPVRTIYDSHASHIHPIRDALRFVRVVVRYLWWPPASR